MIIYREKVTPKDNATVLKEISVLLLEINSLLGQIEFRMAGSMLLETIYKEGTWEDRVFVKERIKELIPLVAKLKELNVSFKSEDTSQDIQKKQSSLKEAATTIEAINKKMLSIWEMRKLGETPDDIKVIYELMKKMFANVNALIRELETYVKDFNKNSNVKLGFKVKWTKLPK